MRWTNSLKGINYLNRELLIGNLNSPISIKDMELEGEDLPIKKIPVLACSTVEIYQRFIEEIIPALPKLF